MRESEMAKYKGRIDYEFIKFKKYEYNHYYVKAMWLVSHYIYEKIRKDWLQNTNPGFTVTMYGIPVHIIDDVDKEYIKLVVEL